MTDPTTPSRGAGAGPGFKGHEDAARALKPAAGVVEARTGIIESTNIDPLNENSNKGRSLISRGVLSVRSLTSIVDDGWANATEIQGRQTRSTGVLDTASDAVQQASTVATGAAKLAYGHLAGDEQAKAGGREAVYGKSG